MEIIFIIILACLFISLFTYYCFCTGYDRFFNSDPLDKTEAFVIRTYNPTNSMIDRMGKWASTIKNRDIWIHIDNTNIKGVKNKIESYFKYKKINNVNFYEYNTSQLINKYPALLEIKNNKKFLKKNKSINWMVHNEPVNMWYNHKSLNYDNVWIVEDDLDFKGDINNFLNNFLNNKADLIAHRKKPVNKDWWWSEVVSNKFNSVIPINKRYKIREHVIRISNNLLNKINDFSNEGILGISEQLTPTICEYFNMKYYQIDKKFIGDPYHFENRINKIEYNNKPNNKLYHPLKW